MAFGNWERGGLILHRKHRERIATFLGFDPRGIDDAMPPLERAPCARLTTPGFTQFTLGRLFHLASQKNATCPLWSPDVQQLVAALYSKWRPVGILRSNYKAANGRVSEQSCNIANTCSSPSVSVNVFHQSQCQNF